MPRQSQIPLAFVIEDWQPVAPGLGVLLSGLGLDVEVLPNILELVRKRIRRDRPALVFVNATSLVIGDHGQWRQLLAGETTSLVMVPPTATASFFQGARTLGFAGMCDPPLSPEKLKLAVDLAHQNRRAARRLRREIHRLQLLQERRQDTCGEQQSGSNGSPHTTRLQPVTVETTTI
jgi:AmiR/NasT family two-component response regulator